MPRCHSSVIHRSPKLPAAWPQWARDTCPAPEPECGRAGVRPPGMRGSTLQGSTHRALKQPPASSVGNPTVPTPGARGAVGTLRGRGTCTAATALLTTFPSDCEDRDNPTTWPPKAWPVCERLRPPGPAPDLSAVVASGQHEAVLPVVQVQAFFCEGLAPLPAEDAQAEGAEAAEGQARPEELPVPHPDGRAPLSSPPPDPQRAGTSSGPLS